MQGVSASFSAVGLRYTPSPGSSSSPSTRLSASLEACGAGAGLFDSDDDAAALDSGGLSPQPSLQLRQQQSAHSPMSMPSLSPVSPLSPLSAQLVPSPSQRLPAVDFARAAASLAESLDAMRSPGPVGLPECLSARSQPGAVSARTLRGPANALAPGLVLCSSGRGVERATGLRSWRAGLALKAARSEDGVVRVPGRWRPKSKTILVKLLPSHGADARGELTRGLYSGGLDDSEGEDGVADTEAAAVARAAGAARAAAAERQRSQLLRHARSDRAAPSVSMRASFLLGAATATSTGGAEEDPAPPRLSDVRSSGLSDSLRPRTSPVFAAGRALADAALAHAQLARLFAVEH